MGGEQLRDSWVDSLKFVGSLTAMTPVHDGRYQEALPARLRGTDLAACVFSPAPAFVAVRLAAAGLLGKPLPLCSRSNTSLA